MNLKSIITKKISTVAICAALLSSAVVPFACADTVKYGDADGNGTIAMGDVTTIQKHIASITKLSADAEKLSDVNVDKVVNLEDVVLIQRFIALLIKEFPADALDKIPDSDLPVPGDTDTSSGTGSDSDTTQNQTEFNFKYHYDSEGNLIIEFIGNP